MEIPLIYCAMANAAQWNYIKPMLSIITLIVMILVGLISALGTLLGNRLWHLAFFDGATHCFSCLIFFGKHSSAYIPVLVVDSSPSLAFVVPALGLPILFAVVIAILYLISLTRFFVLFGLSFFDLLAFFGLGVSLVCQLLTFPALILQTIGRCLVLVEAFKRLPFLTSKAAFHCLLQIKTPLAVSYLIVVTHTDSRAGVRKDNTIMARFRQLFCMCDRDIIAQMSFFINLRGFNA